MIKYSLVVLAAAAVIMSSGCDDSECCGGKKVAVKPAKKIVNVAPTAKIKANSAISELKDCTSGTFDFDGLDSTDKEDGSFNTTDKYIWTVDGKSATADANGNLKAVACPTLGTTKQVCVQVVDSDNKTSANMACMTLGKVRKTTKCKITATPPTTGPAIDGSESPSKNTTKLGNGTYTFKFEGCPAAKNCHWEKISSRNINNGTTKYKKCVVGGNINAGTSGSGNAKTEGGDHISSFDKTAVTLSVDVCNSDWDEIQMQVVCDDGLGVTSYFDLNNSEEATSDWPDNF